MSARTNAVGENVGNDMAEYAETAVLCRAPMLSPIFNASAEPNAQSKRQYQVVICRAPMLSPRLNTSAEPNAQSKRQEMQT